MLLPSVIFRRGTSSFTTIYFPVLFIGISTITSKCALAQESQRSHPSLLQRFWDIGCEFSGVVSRVRRSADNPPQEEPDFDNPEELFNYLYPLADVNPAGVNENGEGSQRSSATGTHSLSTWLEDLMELWHSECHQRRNKRSAERRSSNVRRESGEGRLRRKEYAWVGQGKRGKVPTGNRNSSLLSSVRRQGYETTYENGAEDMYGKGRDEDGILEDAAEDEAEKEEDKLEEDKDKGKDKDKDKGKDKLNALLGMIPKPELPSIPMPPKPTLPSKEEDIFFTQYGGDIEYFFPLLSFGIPFDGEITLLGFHGFRGIFPY